MAVFETNKKQDFDLDHVYETLKRCKQKDDYVNIDEYLQAYHELCRYVKLLFTVLRCSLVLKLNLRNIKVFLSFYWMGFFNKII